MKKNQPSIANKNDVKAFDRYDDVFEALQPNQVIEFNTENQAITVNCENGFIIQIELCNKHIAKVRYAHSGELKPYFSYAISPNFSTEVTEFHSIETTDAITIKSTFFSIQIKKVDATISFLNEKGIVICEQNTPFEAITTMMKGTTKVSLSLAAQKEEAYYGLGDKSWNFDLKGKKFENWCTDAFGFDKNRNALYRAIPFYIAHSPAHHYGIFLDNSYRSHFDFCESNENQVVISADGGEMCFYFIYGKDSVEVAEHYADLTGKPEMPPIWALGFHQCRWSYYPERRVKEVAAEFRSRKIPCDAIYLDIDYMNGYRCFTINEKYFPDLQGLTKSLAEDNFEMVVMIDPGIKVDKNYHVYEDGLKNDAFCKRFNGELMVGPVWPPACVFPDYTNEKIRKWWGELYRDLYNEKGISGFWNDMNEPALFNIHRMTFPDEVFHDFEGQGATHAQIHNVYGMQMSRATIEGLKALKPNKRPFLLTRASFSGGQRYAAVWTGDNLSTWEHLRYANLQAQRLSLSGFSFCGSDIGGFAGKPTGEMMVRWLQLSVFHPLMRIHSMGNHADGASAVDDEAVLQAESENRMDQEPWAYGAKFTRHAKAAIELRYQLLPYLYTAFYHNVNKGTPIIKGAAILEEKFKGTERDFLFGEQIWVSPIENRGIKQQHIELPEGEWFDFHTNQVHTEAIDYSVKINFIPFFIKAGTVLPFAPIRQSTKEKIEQMELRIYLTNGITHSISTLYEDAGEGYDTSLLRTFTVQNENDNFTLSQIKQGAFTVDYSHFLVKVIKENDVKIMKIEEGFEKIEL